MESYSRTRWLDKLRPAGTPHRWMGRGARWHLSWPLADTTAQKKNLTTFLDSCMSSLLLSMLFFSVSFKRETPQTLLEKRVETGKSSGPCTVVIPVQSTVREFHTSLPCRRTSPLDTSCNSLLGNCTQKKNDVSSQGPCCSKKKENTICALTVPAQAFKSDEHQCSSSRASATDEPNATLRRMSSLQMTPMHSHSSRSSSSRHSCKEVCA